MLAVLVRLLRTTFVSVRSAKCEQTIRLVSSESAAVSGATALRDGAAGSALLNEVRMRLGIDVVEKREVLKRLLVMGLRELRMPLKSVGRGPRAPLCASLCVSGCEPPSSRLTVAHLRRGWHAVPPEVVERVLAFAGGIWWARRRWDGNLPLPSSQIKAFSADVPSKLQPLFKRVACFDRTEFSFSDGSVMYIEWGPSGQLWMRGTNLYPLVALLRCERQKQTRRTAASVLNVRGVGEVLL